MMIIMEDKLQFLCPVAQVTMSTARTLRFQVDTVKTDKQEAGPAFYAGILYVLRHKQEQVFRLILKSMLVVVEGARPLHNIYQLKEIVTVLSHRAYLFLYICNVKRLKKIQYFHNL